MLSLSGRASGAVTAVGANHAVGAASEEQSDLLVVTGVRCQHQGSVPLGVDDVEGDATADEIFDRWPAGDNALEDGVHPGWGGVSGWSRL